MLSSDKLLNGKVMVPHFSFNRPCTKIHINRLSDTFSQTEQNDGYNYSSVVRTSGNPYQAINKANFCVLTENDLIMGHKEYQGYLPDYLFVG